MTHWTEASALIEGRENGNQGVIARYAPGALAFGLSAALGVYLVYFRAPIHAPAPVAVEAAEPQADSFGGLAPLAPAPTGDLARKPEGNPYGALVTKGFGTSAKFGFSVAQATVPVPPTPPADLRPSVDVADVPLPPRRPSALARDPEEPAPVPPVVARLEPKPAAPAPVAAPPAPAAPSGPGIFEKLFGGGSSTAAKTPEPRLAYAAPPPPAAASASSALAARGGLNSPTGGFGGFLNGLNIGSGSNPASRYGSGVAVYDISARMVYLPDGTRLEAHSGLGSMRDDPSSVSVRMKGVTPPATYNLTMREALFHGVAAIRLTPIDSNVYGRAGLLAHTYMLGPDGDSNGCISFRDYDAFLNAYRSGKIQKLVVVTRM